MAKKVTIEIDADASALCIPEGRLFLGTDAVVRLDGWTADANCRPVLTLFTPGEHTPVATSSYADGTLRLNLTGDAVRRAFHGEAARHRFNAYLNQQRTADGGSTWEYLPDVEAAGTVWVEWSPETFEVTDDGTAMAALKGPKGDDGADGKSAYELAMENGYSGTLTDWLRSSDIRYALAGQTFEYSGATMRKLAAAIKTIFEIAGGTVT